MRKELTDSQIEKRIAAEDSRDMLKAGILYENGRYTVRRVAGTLTVYRDGLTHATPDSSYEDSADGLSIAKARADWCACRPAGTESLIDSRLVMRTMHACHAETTA